MLPKEGGATMNARCGQEDCDCGYTIERLVAALRIEGVIHRMYEHSQMVTTEDVVARPVAGCIRCKRISESARLAIKEAS